MHVGVYGHNHEKTSVRGTHSSMMLLLLLAAASTLENRAWTRERKSFVYTRGPVRSLLYAHSLTYLGRSWTFLRRDAGEREVSYKLAL